MIEASAAAAFPACARVIVVAGFRAAEIVSLFQGRPGVEVAVNPNFERGMLSSLQCGAAAVRTPRFFLALADMPLVSPDTYRLLLQAPPADAVIPKYRGKKGHPLLLTGAVARAAAAAAQGGTLRDVLAGFATLLLPVEDPHVLHDVDTDRDYRDLLGDNPAGRGALAPPEAGVAPKGPPGAAAPLEAGDAPPDAGDAPPDAGDAPPEAGDAPPEAGDAPRGS